MASKELEVLEDFITQNNLKITNQRRAVLKAFLDHEEHVSAEELYKLVTATEPKLGLATVYRTLALLTKSGLASELDLGGNYSRRAAREQERLRAAGGGLLSPAPHFRPRIAR